MVSRTDAGVRRWKRFVDAAVDVWTFAWRTCVAALVDVDAAP